MKHRIRHSLHLIVPLLLLAPLTAPAQPTPGLLMPAPASLSAGEGALRVDREFRIGIAGQPHERLYRYASRVLRRLDDRTGLFLPQGHLGPADTVSETSRLRIQVSRPGVVALGEDESYRLSIDASGIDLAAPTDIGAMRGLETLLQLLDADADGYFFPAVLIEDRPRFPWRGLLVDSARHWMPVDMIKRTLDGLAAVKMNVLHWHLTEDQGFRVECKTHPLLHELGSDGFYYTQEQIRDIIAYADDRGIRIVPEFDMPGHATSWLVGYPELGSAPGPYQIERKWGIFKPTLDPTRESTYVFLDGFFREMAALFPDEYMHIGGDENTGEHWDANPAIQAFKQANNIADNHALQSYFNQRILELLTKYGKRMIGWDEILQPDMPKNIVIHSWRGRESMVAAAKDGYQSILSNGYYIDLIQPASFHYANDPLPGDIGLTGEEKQRVLGGEATMWSEHVTPETVDSRIWPRTAAIAERLWSPGHITDVESMYARMERLSLQLEELGLTHIKNRPMMMRRLAGGYDFEALRVLADVVEPLKIYQRNADLSYSQFSPYTLLPDVAIPDAPDALRFNRAVRVYLENGDNELCPAARGLLRQWAANDADFRRLAARSPALREALPLSGNLAALAGLGLAAVDGKLDPADAARYAATIETARQPVAKVELQVVDAIQKLVEAALATE